MVAEQEVYRAAPLPHGDPLPIGVVVPRHRAGTAAPLEVVADVIGGHAAQRGFDAVTVTANNEARGLPITPFWSHLGWKFQKSRCFCLQKR